MVYYSFGVGIMRNLVKEIITGRWLKKMSNLTVNTKEKFSIQQIAAIGVMTAVICVLAPFSLPIGPVPISLTNLAKLATTSSTGGLLLALQRAIVTARPKGRYRKHFCWPAIKRYYSNLLVSILLLALLYTFELLHLLYCQSFQHNIL